MTTNLKMYKGVIVLTCPVFSIPSREGIFQPWYRKEHHQVDKSGDRLELVLVA